MSRVAEFHRALGLPAPSDPTVPSLELAALRMRLMREEYEEVKAESDRLLSCLRYAEQRGENPANNAFIRAVLQLYVKEVCDLLYVAEGTLVALGVHPDAFDEVHRSNMSKPGGGHRADGKVLKGPDYTPADPERMFPSIIEHQEAQCPE